MKIIDSHIHLYPKPDLEKELDLSGQPIEELLKNLSDKIIKEKINKALVYILDSKFLDINLKIPNNLFIGIAFEPNRKHQIYLKKAEDSNIKIIKFLPYEQQLTANRYPEIISFVKAAKKKDMILTICSTYGSRSVYQVNGVDLAANIKKEVDIPIILAHGGGPEIFEAMTLALKYNNVFLDLSFSLKYWWGSSVIEDYAFAIKKLDYKKCFYGSDYPFVSFSESLEYFLRFSKEYNFSNKGKCNILYANFEKFRRKYL